MPGPSFNREAIEAEIDRIRSLGLDALRSLWCTTFRSSPPPGFTKDLIARFLCWHIQEQAFGGLDPKTAKHLASLARGDRSRADRPRRLKPGSIARAITGTAWNGPRFFGLRIDKEMAISPNGRTPAQAASSKSRRAVAIGRPRGNAASAHPSLGDGEHKQ
jgi:hypothetical protein